MLAFVDYSVTCSGNADWRDLLGTICAPGV